MTAKMMFWMIGSKCADPRLLRIDVHVLLFRAGAPPSLRSISALMMLQPKSAASTIMAALSSPRKTIVMAGSLVSMACMLRPQARASRKAAKMMRAMRMPRSIMATVTAGMGRLPCRLPAAAEDN